MQQYHGLVAAMAEAPAELVFLPMLRDLPPVKDEASHWLCPVVAGSADVVRLDLERLLEGRQVLSPPIQVGPGFLDAPVFLEACRALAADLGVRDERLALRPRRRARSRRASTPRSLGSGEPRSDRCRAGGSCPSWSSGARTRSTTRS